jgi:hypothetical protein
MEHDVRKPAMSLRWRLEHLILAFGLLLVGLLWTGVVLKVHAEREAEIRNTMTHTANLARAVEEHTVRTFKEADQVLMYFMDRYRAEGRNFDVPRMFAEGPIASRICAYLSIIDAHGDLILGSEPFELVNLADRARETRRARSSASRTSASR